LDLVASASDIAYAAFEGEQEKFDREVVQPSGVDSEDFWMQITERGGYEYTWAMTFQEVLDSCDLGLEPRQTKSHASRKPCPLAPNQRKRRQSLPASWHTWAILAVVAFHALVYACEKPVQVCTWLTEHGDLFPLIRAVLWGKPAPSAPPAIVLKLPPLPPAA
jgi:hypothetical protein